MEHITLDKIHSYTEGRPGGDEALDTEGHIAVCERCHGVFSAFKDMESGMKTAFKAGGEPEADCPEDWEVATLLTGESGAEGKKKLASHMEGCKYCLDRAAVYYKATVLNDRAMATQSEWSDRAVAMLTEGTAPAKTEAPLFKRLWQSVQRISEPLPPLPGYAIGALAIIMLLWVSLSGKEARVVTIPSSQRIAFSETGPSGSFAFMGGESEKMGGMNIRLKSGKLVFNWKPIASAPKYKFSIINAQGFAPVGTVTVVSAPKAALDAGSLERGELYLWVISGKTGDGRTFKYVGKFLFEG